MTLMLVISWHLSRPKSVCCLQVAYVYGITELFSAGDSGAEVKFLMLNEICRSIPVGILDIVMVSLDASAPSQTDAWLSFQIILCCDLSESCGCEYSRYGNSLIVAMFDQ